jgi:pyruvyltransferase
MIPLYWHKSSNFGDALSPWLVERITGEKPTFVSPNDGRPFIVTGSIFKGDIRGVVWGAGCAFEREVENVNPPGDLEIAAMRGKLSTEAVMNAGHSPTAYGDPGFLLPCFYTPKVYPKVNVAIMCSWVDYDDVILKFPGVPVINSMDHGIEGTVDRIFSCDLLLSSTLHGLVAGAAYGIPTRWVSFSDRMVGDGFKYRDAGFTDHVRLTGSEDLSTILPVSVTIPDTKALLDCCPFKGAS